MIMSVGGRHGISRPAPCTYNVVGLFYGTKAPGARGDAETYSMLDRNEMECAKASRPVTSGQASKSRPVRQASQQASSGHSV